MCRVAIVNEFRPVDQHDNTDTKAKVAQIMVGSFLADITDAEWLPGPKYRDFLHGFSITNQSVEVLVKPVPSSHVYDAKTKREYADFTVELMEE